jgi:hypothetical protein
MTNEAQKVFNYLNKVGFNSAREIASDCSLDEIGLEDAIEEIEKETTYVIVKDIHPKSYGHPVIWLALNRYTS